MKRVTSQRTLILGVADAWRRWTYGGGSPWAQDPTKQQIQKELDALDKETASAGDVARIIGNSSWVRADSCDECGVRSFDMVILGEPMSYEPATATICRDCLVKALALLEEK